MTDAAPRRPRLRETLAILFLFNVPFWRRSLARRFARLGAFGCYLYVGVLLVLLTLEDRMLFPGATFGRPPSEPPQHLGVREVTFASEDGETIHAWFTAPKGWTPDQGAVLYSHGNGGNVERTSWRAVCWR